MAVRRPEPISWIDEIVSYYVSDKPGHPQAAAKKAVDGTNTRLIVHHGGVDMLVRKLDSLLPQPVLV